MGWHQKALRVYQWFEKRLAPELRPSYFDYAETLAVLRKPVSGEPLTNQAIVDEVPVCER